MPLLEDDGFVIMIMDRMKPGRKTEGKRQSRKKKTVLLGVCNDRIQGITQVVQSPRGTVERLKRWSGIFLFCTNSRGTGRMVFFDEGIDRKTFHQPVKLFQCGFLVSAELRGQEK